MNYSGKLFTTKRHDVLQESRGRATCTPSRLLTRTALFAIAIFGTCDGFRANVAAAEAIEFQQPDITKSASKLSTGLRTVADAYRTHRGRHGSVGGGERAFRPPNGQLQLRGDYILVDAVAATDANALAKDLGALGARDIAVFGAVVSSKIPLAALDRLESIETLKSIRPAYSLSRVGSVTSQGDVAQRSDAARTSFGIDGTGIRVGVLSDSYDCLGGEAADIAGGDLPDDVVVVKELTGCGAPKDEGRAMLQIVHDVAPGAELGFRTAAEGRADMANGILALAEDFDADVIVDDFGYLNAPFFQDGVIAQAADTVVAMGVAYFSSAGNDADESYESPFVDSGVTGLSGGVFHDFDPGAGVDTQQTIRIPVGGNVVLTFQWDAPFFSISGAPGTQNDLDIYLLAASGDVAAVSNEVNPNTGDAIEVIVFENDGSIDLDGVPGPDEEFFFAIELFSGSAPGLMKYIAFNNGEILEHDTDSSTCFGHPNAATVEAVGAAYYAQTPEFGVSPALIESFSSKGGTPILYTTDGQRVDEMRMKPQIVAPDGGNNTFFGSQDIEPDGFPNFFGTSAAAPHAAAVAALILEENPAIAPAEVYSRLEMSALDMDAPGFDFISGYGLIQADTAVGSSAARCAAPVSRGDSPTSTDCLFILRAAVGVATCDPACECAPTGMLPPRATDALLCLQKAVGLGGELNCPCDAAVTN